MDTLQSINDCEKRRWGEKRVKADGIKEKRGRKGKKTETVKETERERGRGGGEREGDRQTDRKKIT